MSVETEHLKVWELLETKKVFKADPWVGVCVDKIKLPSGRIVDDFYRVELPEYVMVCARNADGKILMERQYKHALKDISLAFPTGCMENGESPERAAQREFLEETGYKAKNWKRIGAFPVDGNKGCGRAHFYLADGLEKVGEPVVDDMEALEIVFLSEDEVVDALKTGKICILASVSLASIATNKQLMKAFNEDY